MGAAKIHDAKAAKMKRQQSGRGDGRWRWWLFWLGVAMGCGMRGEAQDAAYAGHLKAANEEAAAGRIADAMVDIQGALAAEPKGTLGWYQLGSLLGQTGDFPGAEAALRRAIELEPGLAKAHYGLALTLVGNPQAKLDWAGAMEQCRKALEVQPEDAEALNLLGAGLSGTGQAEAAIPVLRHALELAPGLASAHYNLAQALESMDRLEEAVEQYRAAVGAKDPYPEASSALGRVLLRMGRTREAEQAVRTALHGNPDLGEAHYTLARVLHLEKEDQAAAIEFAEAKELTERQARGIESSHLSNTGLEVAAKGDLPGAVAMLRKAIALKPDYGVPHYNLGLLLADSGEMKAAEEELAKAISLLPGQGKLWFDLGRVEERVGDDRGAIEAIWWAMHLSPGNAAMQGELDGLRKAHSAQAGFFGEAVGGGQPAVGATTDTATAHIVFGKELARRGDGLGAAGELLRALALDPTTLEARRALGQAYEQMGEPDRAALEYEKALLPMPADGETLLSLGRLLLARGERGEAVRYLRRAAAARPEPAGVRAMLKQAETEAHR